MPLSLTSALDRNCGLCERFSHSFRINSFVGSVVIGVAVCLSSSVLAVESEDSKQLVDESTATVTSTSLDDASATTIRIAQRDTSSSEQSLLGPLVDFDVASSEEPREISNILGEKHARQEIVTSRSSFSSAFTSALKNIQDQEASQRPTPAVGGGAASPLSALFTAVEQDAVRSAGPSLDLATEVKSAKPLEQQKPKLMPLQLTKPESISPSVAGPIGIPNKSKPIDDELHKYFEGLEKESVPAASTSKSVVTTTPTAKVVPGPGIQDPTPADSAIASPAESQVSSPSQPPSQVQSPPPRKPRPREPNVRITQRMASLQPKVAKTLRFYFDRPLNTKDDSAWSVMHSMLGYGPNGQVAINSERGPRQNVVHWMCQNGVCANRRLLYIQDGYIKGLEGPGFQGHPGQFLAMLAQIGTKREYPMNIQGQRLNVEALVNSEMYTCSSEKELTFKLISLSYYLDSDATWKSESGETWTLPKILSMEMSQPVNGAACGGTHRIMSISCAVRNRWLRGESIDGVYAQAEQYVRQYQQYALSLQNRDGSFSSEWFKRNAVSKDKDRQLQTSGHILEWLVYTLPRNQLADPRIVKGVEFLTNLMSRHRFRDWEVGPRGHAIRALSLYHQRVFERQPATPQMANAALWSAVLR